MKCPRCNVFELETILTKKGIEIDYCPECKGIWLDKNEICYFMDPSYVKKQIEMTIAEKKAPSFYISPKANIEMLKLPLFDGMINLDYCPKTQGIWIDKYQLDLLKERGINIDIESSFLTPKQTFASKTLLPLPNLALYSGITLFGMYALLTLFLLILVQFGIIDVGLILIIGVIVATVQFLISPFIMDWTLRLLYKIKWVDIYDLPQHLTDFIIKVCNQKNIKYPKIGIVMDGSPNAFTYGHHPNNARIVLSQGLLDLLDEREVEAVVAHEVGHIVHWDMLVMTVVQLVPLIFCYIYRTLMSVKSEDNNRSSGASAVIAIGAYILYIISEYVVLAFSRIREYFADRFAGQITGNPNYLASALVKIGYGLAGDDSLKKEGSETKRKGNLDALGTLGIFDVNASRALIVTSTSGVRKMEVKLNKENIKNAAKWELWNPWAVYYELHSTHPLISKRLKFLSNQSVVMGQEPYIEFNEQKPESYWDEFLTDIFIAWLPFLALITSLINYLIKMDIVAIGQGLLIVGTAYLVKVLFRYRSKSFPEMNIRSLLKHVKVSDVRPVPCTIKGKIIGRGIPGLIISEDFIIQDDTGIMFLDYRQPLAIFNILFGLLKSEKYINQDVAVTGWYRRSPIPYIEIKNIETEGHRSTCYVYYVKLIFAFGLILAGTLILFNSLI